MTSADLAASDGASLLPENPFPGLRPFEQHESALFFGRDEQCDELLSRLARRRLVAVVGMSGSGKSSLVRAGLLPGLDRGYLPSAGSSWHIAVFRPGSEPLANLADALARRRLPDRSVAQDDPGAIRDQLDSSSLGLVAVARTLLTDPADSLLVVADQFEEIFRFARILPGHDASEQSAACVDLLVNASHQDDIPVYVVLTMRSDYLGDCSHFTGLPEALNDSQFLVPRMTRAQLRAAIEGPISVCNGLISQGLVQRLLHDVEGMDLDGNERGALSQGEDRLPVLQHALMRMWFVSPEVALRTSGRRRSLGIPQYIAPPVETLGHALNFHAEEVYSALPTDRHREIARRIFQQLTDRDAESREVRRPTNIRELAAVALRCAPNEASAEGNGLVQEVLDAFAGEGRGFVVVNAQQDVDISHESFIRRWERLRRWVDEESRSRRVYVRLAETASEWEVDKASLYRGRQLAEARTWWQEARPTQLWADRYDRRFEAAGRFMARSIARRRLGLGLLFGYIGVLLAAAVAIVFLLTGQRDLARQAEAAALEVRNTTEAAKRKQEEAAKNYAQALDALRQGNSDLANQLARKGQQAQNEVKDSPVLTGGELADLKRLRQAEAAWKAGEANLQRQIEGLKEAAANPTRAVARPEQQLTEMKDQLAARSNELKDAQRTIAELRKRSDEPGGQTPRRDDTFLIARLLSDYEAAYEKRDAVALAKLVPSLSVEDLRERFKDIRKLTLDISGEMIAISGDSATVTFRQLMTIDAEIGKLKPQTLQMKFKLRRVNGTWGIEAVEKP